MNNVCCCEYDPPGLRCTPCKQGSHLDCRDLRKVLPKLTLEDPPQRRSHPWSPHRFGPWGNPVLLPPMYGRPPDLSQTRECQKCGWTEMRTIGPAPATPAQLQEYRTE